MRIALTVAATALLTACAISCAPPAPSSVAPDSLPAVSDPLFTELIDDARPATGQWFFRSDEGVSAACFGAPQSECQLSIRPRSVSLARCA